jgi:hypothetical protein
MRAGIALVVALAATGCSFVPTSRVRTPVEILSRAEPTGLAWRPSQRIDIDCNGTDDDVMIAQDQHRFYVGVVLNLPKQERYSVAAFALTGD